MTVRYETEPTATVTAHRDAIGALIRLHREIVAHSTFDNGAALQQSRTLLQNRLVRIERAIRKAYEYPRRAEITRVDDASPAQIQGQPALAQFQIPQIPGRGPGGNGANGRLGAGVGNNGGGRGGLGGQIGANGQLPDIGPELADLIQQVIDPTTWNVNGGPGSIIYFRPLRALIVTATTEVHHRLGDLAGQMRDAL